VADSCKHDNKPFGSVKGTKFFYITAIISYLGKTVIKVGLHSECPISPEPLENSIIGKNTEKYKQGNVVLDFLPGTSVTGLNSLHYQ
jgi:hypothetical protein